MNNMKNRNYVNLVHKELSYKIIGVLFDVYNELGPGYQEKYYERAIAAHFKNKKINHTRQAPCKIISCGEIIGRLYLDFIVENKIVLELKKGDYFPKQNIDQVIEYLIATNLQLAILANFTKHGVKHKRILNPNRLISTISND
jgi:GxxExxY protein